jgi:O-antigen ligase
MVALVHVGSPGSLGTVFTPTAGLSSASTNHRATDFESVTPDVLARPLLGRGFGTLDPTHPKQFRINDNEYIDEVWQVGILGLLAYLWMILSPIVMARRAIRSKDPEVAPLALAASAGCVAYLVVNALFDAMSFAQAPYMFFMIAALTTVAVAGPAGNVRSLNPRHRPAGAPVRPALAEAT